MNVADIKARLQATPIDPYWAFIDKTRKDTAYITHGYHRYPAKFIPQVVSNLVERYTKVGELVADPFTGCGTTLVESRVMGRASVGVDINPVAVLITRAKTQMLDPVALAQAFEGLKARISGYNKNSNVEMPTHERIDYWFRPQEKHDLSVIFL